MKPDFKKVINLLSEALKPLSEAIVLIHEAHIEVAKYRHPEEDQLAKLGYQIAVDINDLVNIKIKLSLKELSEIANKTIVSAEKYFKEHQETK